MIISPHRDFVREAEEERDQKVQTSGAESPDLCFTTVNACTDVIIAAHRKGIPPGQIKASLDASFEIFERAHELFAR